MKAVVKQHCDSVIIYAEHQGFLSTGIQLKKSNKKLVQRLISAIEGGVVHTNPQIKLDTNGKPYLSTSVNVMGRYLASDLSKLGY